MAHCILGKLAHFLVGQSNYTFLLWVSAPAVGILGRQVLLYVLADKQRNVKDIAQLHMWNWKNKKLVPEPQ